VKLTNGHQRRETPQNFIMRFHLIPLILLVANASGFTLNNNAVRSQRRALQMSTETEDVPIVINGKNVELTPSIVEYVNKRIGGNLNKLASNGLIRECDVHLSVSKNPKVENGHRVEVTTSLKGITIHTKSDSPDMYSSIDAASHAMSRKLKKYKERRMEGWHGGKNIGDNIIEALESMEEDWSEVEEVEGEFLDPEAPVVTNINSFDLENGISLKEAIFALDYTDHDFYVFRNSETHNINVVYKRNAGGVGLIEP